jgi:drug/metabolite transporter (DMT)-like permease
MTLLGNICLGLSGLLGLLGVLMIWLPPLGIPLLVAGGLLYALAGVMKREGRKRQVRRQLSDR